MFHSGLSSTSQFVARLFFSYDELITQHVLGRELLERQRIVCRRWWEFSPLPLLQSLSYAHVICFIDSPEADPGRILSPSDPSVSASGPTSAFGAPSSITTMPASMEMGGNGSNCEAIIGGIIGGIAAISIILVAVLFFYRRRRRSLVSPPVFDGDIGFNLHMDQVSRSASSPETVSSCFPETPTSPLRPYVHIFILSPSSAHVCSHNSLFP